MPFIRTTRKRAGEESFWRRKSDFPFKLTLDESTREFKHQANRPKIDRLANFACLIRDSLCQFAFQTEMDVLRYVGNVEQAENVIINSTLTWYGIKTIEFPNSSSTNLRENSINEKKGNSIPLGRWCKWNFYRRTFWGYCLRLSRCRTSISLPYSWAIACSYWEWLMRIWMASIYPWRVEICLLSDVIIFFGLLRRRRQWGANIGSFTPRFNRFLVDSGKNRIVVGCTLLNQDLCDIMWKNCFIMYLLYDNVVGVLF